MGSCLRPTIIIQKLPTFIFYDVDCDHCQEQAAAIAKNIKHFKKTTLLWVTIGEDSKIEAFKQKYFKNTKNVIFLNDRDMNIFEAFNGTITDTPTTLIFDKAAAKLHVCIKLR